MNRPYQIGLTGNIACGKSTVLQELERLGAAVLDADAVAHQAMRSGTAVHAAIIAAFGLDILDAAGEIDRRALGAIVFRDPAALAQLEAIVHPAVVAYTEEWLGGLKSEVAVIDAIKLIEAGIADRCDEVWVVTCPPEEQVRRLQAYRGLSEEEAWTRIRAQPPQQEKVDRADVVIDNSGSIGRTRAQVRSAYRRRARHRQRTPCIRSQGDSSKGQGSRDK